MTDPEFSAWVKKLFVAFPSLYEWLQRNSPDPKATQAHWREQLRNYSAAECDWVLSQWASGAIPAFEAYERDKVAICTRAVIDKQRDKRRQRERSDQMRVEQQAKRNKRDSGDLPAIGLTQRFDSEMQMAFIEGRPVHQRFLDGEITREEYEQQRDEIIERHFSKSQPRMQEWQP